MVSAMVTPPMLCSANRIYVGNDPNMTNIKIFLNLPMGAGFILEIKV
jgi:hypothetical protein